MRAKVVQYTDDDLDKFDNEWQPTGTYHLTA